MKRIELEQLNYPAPGAPDLGKRVCKLLNEAGLRCEEDDSQGFDHGVWTPLYLMFPDADIPVCSLSVSCAIGTEAQDYPYDSSAHIAAGRALGGLLDEDILLVRIYSHLCSHQHRIASRFRPLQ